MFRATVEKIKDKFALIYYAISEVFDFFQNMAFYMKVYTKDLFVTLFIFIGFMAILFVFSPLVVVLLAISTPSAIFTYISIARKVQDEVVFFETCAIDPKEYMELPLHEAVRRSNSVLGEKYNGMYTEIVSYVQGKLSDSLIDIDKMFMHEFIDVDGKKIHVIRSKEFDKNKKTIIFFHGNTGTNFNMFAAMHKLGNDYNVIFPEMCGYGLMGLKNNRKPLTSEVRSYSQGLSKAFFDKHIFPEPDIVVGHSLGSKIAVNFATYSEKAYQKKFQHVVLVTTFYSVARILFDRLNVGLRRFTGVISSFIFKFINFFVHAFVSQTSDWSADDAIKLQSPLSIVHGIDDEILPVSGTISLSKDIIKKRAMDAKKYGRDFNGVKNVLLSSAKHMPVLEFFLNDRKDIIEGVPKDNNENVEFELYSRVEGSYVQKHKTIYDPYACNIKAACMSISECNAFNAKLNKHDLTVENVNPLVNKSFVPSKVIRNYLSLDEDSQYIKN